jgi:putative DNA primase/helicase
LTDQNPAEQAIADAVNNAPIVTTPRGQGSESQNLRLSKFLRNDVGNAQRLIDRYGNDLIFVKDIGWFVWTGTHWSSEDGDRQAQIFAHKTALAIFDEVSELQKHGRYDGEDDKSFENRVTSLRKWASGSGNANRIRAMLSEAAPYLGKTIEDLDKDPYLFNVQNGTLNLKAEIKLQKHRRKDYITKISPSYYKPESTYATFRKFLHDIQPNDDDQLFLQRYFGYSLTGNTSEHCLLLCYGTGRNGKGTLVDIVSYILGDYATTISFASLLQDDRRSGAQASPDIARLPGARFVSAAEADVGAKFSEGLLKSLTGGDIITTRHLNQGFFEFRPQFKLCLSFNNKPIVRGQDEGIWSRLMMLNFNRFIPSEQRDKNLKEKLQAEADGILNWLLDGLSEWKEKGLAIPESVRAATADYRSDSDPIGQFLATATERKNGVSVTAKELYGGYCKWCAENAATPISTTAFGKRIVEKGIERTKSGIILYRDIELRPEYLPKEKHDSSHPYDPNAEENRVSD